MPCAGTKAPDTAPIVSGGTQCDYERVPHENASSPRPMDCTPVEGRGGVAAHGVTSGATGPDRVDDLADGADRLRCRAAVLEQARVRGVDGAVDVVGGEPGSWSWAPSQPSVPVLVAGR